MKVRRIIILTVLLTIIYATTSLHVMTVAHEHGHVQVFEANNCQNINIEYEYFDFDTTLAYTEAACPSNQEVTSGHETVHEAQNIINFAWAGSVLLFELLVIQYLVRNQVKNHDLQHH